MHKNAFCSLLPALLAWVPLGITAADQPPLRVGIIGLDTSHAVAFARLLNQDDDPQHVPGARIVAASPRGSLDIPSSVRRVPEYTETLTQLGVPMVESISHLVGQVDAVLLESNDGRVHLDQAVPVLAARKPVFIDKPLAGTLVDAVAIVRLAEHYGTPVLSSSSLRFGMTTLAVRNGSIGEVTGCDTYSPCSLEATHPDLFWYGIHGVESLFTVMGPDCESVYRTTTPSFEQATGVWSGGRVGTFRGIRAGKGGYGGIAFGTTGTAAVGGFDGYRPLLVEIISFFRTGKPPVSAAETLAIYAFMEAADESKRTGQRVRLADVLSRAEQDAATIVARSIARQAETALPR